MTEHELRVFIWNIHNNNKLFSFSLDFHDKITSYAQRWQKKWEIVFNQILEDMINETGDKHEDNNNEGGFYLELPVNIYAKEWMVVFFRPPIPSDKSYLIYDFYVKSK